MKIKLITLAGAAIVLAATEELYAQYTPPPPPVPFPGFLNEALRKDNPYASAWDLGGSERVRFEDHEGYSIAGVPGLPGRPNNDFRAEGADVYNAYELSKLRIHAGYTAKWWSAYVEGRSSYTWDDDRFAYPNVPAVPQTIRTRGSGPESDTIDLQQAYFTIGNHKEFPLSVKIGRQELSYGEERLVGAFAWNNIGRVFDAAKVRWQNEWFGADFFTSRVVIPEDGRFNVDNDYDFFSGVYATSGRIPKHTLDLYFLARNSSPKAIAAEPRPQFPQPSARDIYTIGTRFKSAPGQLGNWDYSVEGAYQFGDYRDTRLVVGGASPRLDHSAYMAVVQAGYTFADAWAKPRIGAEFDYGSGDSNPTDGKHGTFENLFPTNHKFYGSMDLISLQNMIDAGLNLSLKPTPRWSVTLMGNALWLANTSDNFYTVAGAPRGGLAATPNNGYGINPGYSSFLGTEVTIIAGYALTKYAQIEAGYGHFFRADYIKSTWSAPGFGSRDADFTYVQLNLTF
jgi:hypothetical protein